MKRIIRRIVFYVYLFTVLPLVCAILSQFVSPAIAWPLAFFGLLFPILILIQFIFLVLMALLGSRAAVIPLLLILASWTPLVHTFQFPLRKESDRAPSGQFSVMSYNVRLFDYYKWSGQQDAGVKILRHISDSKPDIVCLQEFMTQEQGLFTLDHIKSELGHLPYQCIEYSSTGPNRNHGLAIFSRYPIIASGHEHFEGTRNMSIYSDIIIDSDTIRIYNNHLESIHFNRREVEWIDDKTDTASITGDKVTQIMHRMKPAYIRRAHQSRQIHQSIVRSPYPVVVCGDFNDTPVSYAVSRIRKGLNDSFLSGGRWMGITYPDIRIPLRIDFILYSEQLESSGFTTGKIGHSDHRPVSCRLRIK